MKQLIAAIFSFFSLACHLQEPLEPFAHLGIQGNVTVLNPQLRDDFFQTSATVYRAFAGTRVVKTKNFRLYAGVTMKREAYYQSGNVQAFGGTVFYYSNGAVSKSYGLYVEMDKTLHSFKKMNLVGGVQSEVYLKEYYTAESPMSAIRDWKPFIKPAASTVSVFCRSIFFPDKPVTFATKLSLGTSLYADWDVFSRYVWLSLGVEIVLNK